MRILFTTHAAPSHFSPLQPLAVAARSAGHEVAFASGSALKDTIQRVGFTYFQAGANMDDPSLDAVKAAARTLPVEERSEYMVARVFGGILAERALPELLAVFDRFQYAR